MGVDTIDAKSLEELKQNAKEAPSRRARLCMHAGHEAPIQEMVIALWADSELPAHRQRDREKSYLVLEGGMDLMFFSDDGECISRARLGAVGGAAPFLRRFDAGRWHTTRPVGDVVVYVESLPGPFNEGLTETAPWGPSSRDTEWPE